METVIKAETMRKKYDRERLKEFNDIGIVDKVHLYRFFSNDNYLSGSITFSIIGNKYKKEDTIRYYPCLYYYDTEKQFISAIERYLNNENLYEVKPCEDYVQ